MQVRKKLNDNPTQEVFYLFYIITRYASFPIFFSPTSRKSNTSEFQNGCQSPHFQTVMDYFLFKNKQQTENYFTPYLVK